MYEGQMGGFFRGIGWTGLAVFGIGLGADAVIHGVTMQALAKYLAKRELVAPAEPTDEQIESQKDKADLMISGIAAIPIGAFGAWRLGKGDYESDMLDAAELLLGGAMSYEIGSTVEVVSTWIKMG